MTVIRRWNPWLKGMLLELYWRLVRCIGDHLVRSTNFPTSCWLHFSFWTIVLNQAFLSFQREPGSGSRNGRCRLVGASIVWALRELLSNGATGITVDTFWLVVMRQLDAGPGGIRRYNIVFQLTLILIFRSLLTVKCLNLAHFGCCYRGFFTKYTILYRSHCAGYNSF